MAGQHEYEEMVASLARHLAPGGDLSGEVLARAGRLLEATGVRALVDHLALAERVILAGEGFHSVERFFVEGSDEHRFVVDLVRRAGPGVRR